MTTRAAKRAEVSAVDIPAKDLLAMLQDPAHYDKMIRDLAERQANAEAAEAAAHEARDSAEKAKAEIEAASKAAEEALERARAKHEQEMAEARADAERTRTVWGTRTAQCDARVVELDTTANRLADWEVRLTGQKIAAKEEADAQTVECNRLATLSIHLADQEASLAARGRDLGEREGKFKNRLRQLNEGL